MRISDWSSDVCSSDLQIVDLGRLHRVDQADQRRGIGHVAVMQEEADAGFMTVLIEMVDTPGVDLGGWRLVKKHSRQEIQQHLGKHGANLYGGPSPQRDLVCNGEVSQC